LEDSGKTAAPYLNHDDYMSCLYRRWVSGHMAFWIQKTHGIFKMMRWR